MRKEFLQDDIHSCGMLATRDVGRTWLFTKQTQSATLEFPYELTNDKAHLCEYFKTSGKSSIGLFLVCNCNSDEKWIAFRNNKKVKSET